MTFGCRCKCPRGCVAQGGLRLWINPADWTGLLSGLWRQFILLFALGAGVALVSAFLTTALYTRRFRLISDTLRQAEAGTYAARPQYASHDEVGASLDLIDRLVMKQRKNVGAPAPVQRLAIAARTLAHEVKTPLNCFERFTSKCCAKNCRRMTRRWRSAAALYRCPRFEHSPGRSSGARLYRLLGAGDDGA